MIADAKGGLKTAALEWYISRKLRSAFRGVWVRGEFPPSEGGLVAYMNHSSFWDGFLAQQLGAVAGWDAYAVMEEENLRRYRFHTWIGAFSVRRGDAKSAMQTIRYAKDVLRRPGAAIFIFPEGELKGGLGPLQPFKRGVEVLARAAGVPSVPVALRYAFLEHELPDVLVEVGAPHPPGPMSLFEEQLGRVYERVKAATSTEGFTRVVTGRRSIQEWWDGVRGAKPSGGLVKRQNPV